MLNLGRIFSFKLDKKASLDKPLFLRDNGYIVFKYIYGYKV